MIALLDGDILPYEMGFAAEYGKEDLPSFEYVKELVDGRIQDILRTVEATEAPEIYLTGKGNFREEIAIKRGYKANRKDSKKPFHFENIRQYLIASYGAVVVEGMEADDMLAIRQTEALKAGINTIICSRDKDLRQVPGNHFSWECGKQGEIGPYVVDELGEFWTNKMPKELKGTGYRFFAAQVLMGDKVDNIPGLPGWGPVKTLTYLSAADDITQINTFLYGAFREYYFDRYKEMYKSKASDSGLSDEDIEGVSSAYAYGKVLTELKEQAQLVWMVRELDEEGNPVMWRLGYGG